MVVDDEWKVLVSTTDFKHFPPSRLCPIVLQSMGAILSKKRGEERKSRAAEWLIEIRETWKCLRDSRALPTVVKSLDVVQSEHDTPQSTSSNKVSWCCFYFPRLVMSYLDNSPWSPEWMVKAEDAADRRQRDASTQKHVRALIDMLITTMCYLQIPWELRQRRSMSYEASHRSGFKQ